jgi:peptidoglycan/xylan/chitin deacetylase (PgdA/CDA1 family)
MIEEMNTPQVALTFEAGGDEKVAAQMLDLLHGAGARATIFLHGAWASSCPELVRRMVNEGHELGNHTYTHPNLTLLEDKQIREELRRTSELAHRLAGRPAEPWFRPPFGAIDERVRDVVAAEGYRIVQRNAVDGGHWPGRTTGAKIVARTLENAYDGAIIAYHLGSAETVRVMPSILSELRKSRCRLVSLSDLPTVSEHPRRHPGLADLEIEPGYLQVEQPPARAWSMNLLEYGARASHEPGTTVRLTETGYGVTQLHVGQGEETWQVAANEDRHLLAIAGTVECRFRLEGKERIAIRALARRHDFILWPAGHEMQLAAPGGAQGRWIVLILAGADAY